MIMAEPVRADRPGDIEGSVYEVVARYAPYVETQRYTDEIMALFVDELERHKTAFGYQFEQRQKMARELAAKEADIEGWREKVASRDRVLEQARASAAEDAGMLGQLRRERDGYKGTLEFVADQLGLPLDAVHHPVLVGGAMSMRIKELKRAKGLPLACELDRLFPCADCAAWPWDQHGEGCSAVVPVPRVWQQGDPEPPADVVRLRDREGVIWSKVPDREFMWESIPTLRCYGIGSLMADLAPLTEVLPGFPSGGGTDA
jgi:hypothetical protein